MEELSERAKRILGNVSDGSIQGDLAAALDLIEALKRRAVPSALWRPIPGKVPASGAVVGEMVLSTRLNAHNQHYWSLCFGTGLNDTLAEGVATSMQAAQDACEAELLRQVGAVSLEPA